MRRVVLIDQLRQAQGARHASRAAADDDDIGRHLRAFDAFNGFAENQHTKPCHGFSRINTDKPLLIRRAVGELTSCFRLLYFFG